MRKKYFLIAGIVILSLVAIGMLWGLHLYNQPHVGVEDVTPVAKLDAAELFGAFQADEAGANKRYLGQVVEVKGKVADIKMDSTLMVQLDGGSGIGGIICSMAPSQKSKTLQPVRGTVLTIKGRCTGYLMDVNLVDCVVEQTEQ